ncbi:Uncharacterised protein r2_g2922 [Pycnogonum litorale]
MLPRNYQGLLCVQHL